MSTKEFVRHARLYSKRLIHGSIDPDTGVITGVDTLGPPADLKVAGNAVAIVEQPPRPGQIEVAVQLVDHSSPIKFAGEFIMWGFMPITITGENPVPVKISDAVAGQWFPMAALRNYDGDIAAYKLPVIDYVNLFAGVTHLHIEFTGGSLPGDVYAWYSISEGLI